MSNDSSVKIAFVQSCWHEDIVDQARLGFAEQLEKSGVNVRVDYFRVPGAFEIPLKCKQLLKTGEYALAAGAGFVVDGGIYRHEFVAQTVVNALMQVQLELSLPVLSVVLTPKQQFNEEEHHTFFFDHMKLKGAEAAVVAAELLKQSQVASPKSQAGARRAVPET